MTLLSYKTAASKVIDDVISGEKLNWFLFTNIYWVIVLLRDNVIHP